MSQYMFALLGQSSESLLRLTFIDLVIIGLYFGIVLYIGFYLKKYAQTGEDFFLAGRQMTAWVAGLSFISANLSSLETIGWSAMAYQYGMLGAHAYLIGAIPAILFLAIVMMPFYYVSRTHSVPGYLKLRYGEGARLLGGISFSFMTVMVSGASMFAMAKILRLLLGWSEDFSIWVSSITVAIYVALGGLRSAIFNEVLQYFLIWGGLLLIPILGLIHVGGWANLMERIQQNVPFIHPSVGNADFTSLWKNLASFETNPMGIDWFGMVFGLGLAVSFGYWCTDFLQVQRVIVAKSLRDAQNGTIIGAFLKMLVILIVTIPGLLGLAVLTNPDGSIMVLVPESDPRARITHHTFNEVLPLLMGQYLGPGLLGLGVTAMIAGFMSGMAGNVSAFATVWTYDVYQPIFRKTAPDVHYVWVGRVASVTGILISIATAYTLRYFSNILEFLQVLVFFFIVPLFGVIITGMLWKRATPAGGFWGLLSACMVAIIMWIYVHFFPQGYRPDPRILISPDSKAVVEKDADGIIRKLSITEGSIELINVPIDTQLIPKYREVKLENPLNIPATITEDDKDKKIQILAPRLIDSSSGDVVRFGLEAVEVEVKPGVKVRTQSTVRKFDPAAFNPQHAKLIARSEKAKPMAINMYSAWWSLVVSIVVTIVVSLFTRPKSERELRNLVMGLTELPEEGPCPWHRNPKLWATVVALILIAINVVFW